MNGYVAAGYLIPAVAIAAYAARLLVKSRTLRQRLGDRTSAEQGAPGA
jgi:hypothetical protein